MFDIVYDDPRGNHVLFQPLNVEPPQPNFLQLLRFWGQVSQQGRVQILSMLWFKP